MHSSHSPHQSRSQKRHAPQGHFSPAQSHQFNPEGFRTQDGFLGQDERGIAYYNRAGGHSGDFSDGDTLGELGLPPMTASDARQRYLLSSSHSTGSDGSMTSLSHTSHRPMTTSKVMHGGALMSGEAIYNMDDDHQEAVAEAIKQKLSQHCINLTDTFLSLDKDRSGYITPADLKESLYNMQIGFTMQEIASLMMSFDDNIDGKISYSEFIQWMRQWGEENTGLQWESEKPLDRPQTQAMLEVQRRAAEKYEQEMREHLKTAKDGLSYEQLIKTIAGAVFDQQIQLRKLFNKHDRNKNGSLDKQEFRAAMEELGYNFTDDQLDSLFSHFDADGNGKVNFWEFVRALGADEDGAGALSPGRPRSARHLNALDDSKALRDQELFDALLEPVDSSMSDEDIVRLIADRVERTGMSMPSLWKSFNTNARRHLGPQELSGALRKLGLNVPMDVAQRLVNRYDCDQDGELSLGEFSQMLHSVGPGTGTAAPWTPPNEEVPDSLSDHQIFQVCVRKAAEAGMPLPEFVRACDTASGGKGVNGTGLKQALQNVGANLSFDRAKALCEDYSMDGSGAIPAKQFLQLLQAEAAKMGSLSAKTSPRKAAVNSREWQHSPQGGSLSRMQLNGIREEEVIPNGTSNEEIFRKILERMGQQGVSIPQMQQFVDEQNSGKMNGWGLKTGMKKLGLEIELERAIELVKDYSLAADGSFMPTKAFGSLLQAQASKFRMQTPMSTGTLHTSHSIREDDVDPDAERQLIERAHMQLMEEENMSAAQLRRRYMTENEIIKKLRDDLFAQNRMMKSMFRRMDRNDDGNISYIDFTHEMQKIGMPISDIDAMRILERFDRTGDGRLDYNEFMRLLQNASDILVHDTGVKATVDLSRFANTGATWGADGLDT